MPRRSHPKQEIEDALRYAESHGWRVEVGGSHAWGKIYCPMTNNVAVGNSVLPAFGVPQKMLELMPNKSNE